MFGTADLEHPGVKRAARRGRLRRRRELPRHRAAQARHVPPYRLTPAQTRPAFAERGWKSVVGFQTRNPVHRAHEYLQKCAMEIVDGLLLHPLVGATKSDDVPADVGCSATRSCSRTTTRRTAR